MTLGPARAWYRANGRAAAYRKTWCYCWTLAGG